MIRAFRVLLIRIAKILPFVFCLILFVSYFESLYSVATCRYAYFNGSIVPVKTISWAIASLFEYDWTVMIVLVVLSVAVETCIWNKLACAFLFVSLIEKYCINIELEVWQIYAIAAANMLVSSYLTYKGARVIWRNINNG